MPGCSNTVSVVVCWLLERDPEHSVIAEPSRHSASLGKCFWYILYIIVTPYYMFRPVSHDYFVQFFRFLSDVRATRFSRIVSFEAKRRNDSFRWENKAIECLGNLHEIPFCH